MKKTTINEMKKEEKSLASTNKEKNNKIKINKKSGPKTDGDTLGIQ